MIAVRDWWEKADSIELAIVDALKWMGPSTAAELTRVFGGVFGPTMLLSRLRRLVSEGIVEVIDARRVRGITVRRYRVADDGGNLDRDGLIGPDNSGHPGRRRASFAGLLLLAVAIGYPLQRHYLANATAPTLGAPRLRTQLRLHLGAGGERRPHRHRRHGGRNPELRLLRNRHF